MKKMLYFFIVVFGMFLGISSTFALSEIGTAFNNLTSSGITETTELAQGAGGGIITFSVGIYIFMTLAAIVIGFIGFLRLSAGRKAARKK